MIGDENYVWNIFQTGCLHLRPTSLAREAIKGAAQYIFIYRVLVTIEQLDRE